jgi:ABC-2 type transport system ATP-binding protein
MELQVHNIHKSFKDKHVLKGISFNVQSGQALGLLGRNGAGKTTTIRILTDIFRADTGEVLIDGRPIDYSTIRMGYLPEERGLYPKVKVGEQMIYIGRLRGMNAAAAKKSAQNLLEELNATEYWEKKLDTLSKGNQQKIQLAIAVLHNPDVVILDEPFSGLDPVNAQILKDLISKEVKLGKVVLFSSHQMSYVEEFCAHICIIHHGEIVLDGKIREIKKTYPRNRISVSTENPPGMFLSEASRRDGWPGMVAEARAETETVEVTLKNAGDKQKFITFLSGCNGIDGFKIVEPTLHDIFVEYAKDEITKQVNDTNTASYGKAGEAS